jgi:hypothetical protein
MALQLNPLNKFSSYNYIWFMDVATRQEIRTSAYKNKRGRIIRSGGIANTAGAALQTADEQNLKVKGEYFIDNVRTQAYVSPNPYSGIANVTRIEFEVTEPYSIGLFLQTLQLAAGEAGYKNYLEAPFTLGVEFTGFDSSGKSSTIQKRVLLLKITKATFNITSAGSVYSVQAIPWNHQALLDQIDKIPVNISIKGDTVEEILTSLDDGGITDVFDTVNTPAGLQQVVVGQELTRTRSLIKELKDFEKRDIAAKSNSEDITPTEYEIIFPIDPSQRGTKNDFARKKIAENFTDLGNQDLGLPEELYNDLNSLYERRRLSISENGRVYQFPQGTKIEKIIEEVLLTSEWSNDIVNLKPDNDGNIEWFKILTFVDILDGDRDRFGSLPKKYTYMVYPYKLHISNLVATNEIVNYNVNIRNAVKGYNYTYTGENTDILDFNIDIDYAWVQAVSKLTQTSQQERNQGDQLLIEDRVQTLINRGVPLPAAEAAARNEVEAEQQGTTNTYDKGIGGNNDSEQTRVARAFNDAIINSNADLIKLKMTIWGDPYYLADTDFGGYIAEKSINPNQDREGAMDYTRSEIDVLLKFAGAVDYKNNLLAPNTARQFSGVYRVTRVNSMFENGIFKQELEMIRRRNQDSISIDNTVNVVDAKAKNIEPFLQPASSGVSNRELSLFLRQAEETEKLFNVFGQLRIQDLTSALNLTPFGLISQINNFVQLFDQVKQIKSAVSNLGSLAGNINLSNINSQSLQQLTQELTGAQGFFSQAFSQIDVSTITQVLNQSQPQADSLLRITGQGVQGVNVATAPPLQGLASIIRPLPRPPINIYDDAISRTTRNQVTPSAPRPPTITTQQSEIDREAFWKSYEFRLIRERNRE